MIEGLPEYPSVDLIMRGGNAGIGVYGDMAGWREIFRSPYQLLKGYRTLAIHVLVVYVPLGALTVR